VQSAQISIDGQVSLVVLENDGADANSWTIEMAMF